MTRALILSFAALAWLAASGCSADPVRASAFRIERQDDLIGGPLGLGQVGDYMLQNGKIRVTVQDAGFSRGFGVYGGSIIDADLRRADAGNAMGGKGNDRFAEMFPAFFLQAAKPRRVEVVNDGSDGKAAVVRVVGDAGPFLSQVNLLNQAALGEEQLGLFIEYILEPNDNFIKMRSSIRNVSQSPRNLRLSLGSVNLRVPFGTVALFGSLNKVFVPGVAGFDLRFALPELVKQQTITLPALPGMLTDFIATKGDGVSYGVFAEPNAESNFAYQNRDQYGAAADPGSLQIPFFFSSFIGYYYGVGPDVLDVNETFAFTQYFVIGDGDVASIRDTFHAVRGHETGGFGGRVRDAQTLRPAANVSIMVYDAAGLFFNQHTTDMNGDFRGDLPPGDYAYQIVSDRTPVLPPTPFSVVAGKTTSVEPIYNTAAFLNVQIVDELGTRVPAKVVVTGVHDYLGSPTPDASKHLFNLARGERRRPVDQVPDVEDDPSTRRFVEAQFWTHDGIIGEQVRPGRYTVHVSRGVEYEVESRDVELVSGEVTSLAVTLRRVVDTSGYVSGDLHLHSSNSIDSSTLPRDRVIGCAAEGLDFAVATDHNFVTDYAPQVTELGLEQFLVPIVGLELTTLELGHFNGYPLDYDLAAANRGSFSWFNRKAQDIFNDLRALGKYGPEHTLIQVNHPRDSLLGYFSQLGLDPDNMERFLPASGTFVSQGDPFLPENLSYEFDVIEIMNGKRWDLLRTVRAPDPLPPPPYAVPDVKPGDILRTANGRIAYPGAVDDWFKLLNRGFQFTGVANSDSHANSYEEPGYPRTYVHVGKDDPFSIRDREITDAIKQRKATLTNGPFVELFVNETAMGDMVRGAEQANVRVRIQKPSWVSVQHLTLYMNGAPIRRYTLHDQADETIYDALAVPGDSWIVAEVSGESKSLWPVVTGWEEPPLTVQDAIAALAGPLGIEFDSLGSLQPVLVRPVYPYAITNPVWIDAEGDGMWVPPGNPMVATRSAAARQAERVELPPPDDVRALFKLFGGGH